MDKLQLTWAEFSTVCLGVLENATTLSITKHSIMGLFVTLSINDTQQNNLLHYAKCCYVECHILFIVMLSVVILIVIMLSAVMLSVICAECHLC